MTGLEFCEIQNLVLDGPRAKKPEQGERVWLLNLDQIESGSANVLNKILVKPSDLGGSTHAFESGTVLYSKLRPYLNKVVVADEDGYATTELVPLRCNPQKAVPDYVAHYLRSPGFLSFATAVVAGAKMPRMVMGEFWAHKLPVPSIPEQRRIAAILDQADALRAKRREALAQLDGLAQAIFVEMFGDPETNPKNWKKIAFEELLAKIESGWSPVCLDRPVEHEEWGVLKLGAVTSCIYDETANKALTADTQPDPSIEVKAGDLLFSRKNTYDLVAACAYVNSTIPKLMMSDLIFRFKLRDESIINKRYLHALLTNSAKRREVQKLAGGSSGSMPNISKAKLERLLIELPPPDLQQTFATRIQAVESLKTTHRAALAELDALFASLQQRAFSGLL